MKTELTPEDRERIEKEARIYAIHNLEPDWIITDFMAGAEYENKYQREQQAKDLKDAYSAGLMCERILSKDKIERLEAERTELIRVVDALRKCMADDKRIHENEIAELQETLNDLLGNKLPF